MNRAGEGKQLEGVEASLAYLDCFSGISGDMFLGALLDAGLPEETLREEWGRLGLAGYQLTCRRERRGALHATRAQIEVRESQPHRSWAAIRSLLAASGLTGAVKEKSLQTFALLAAAEAKVHGCPPEEVHFHEVGGVDAILDIVGVCAGLHHLGVDRLMASPLPMPRGWVECAHGWLPLPAPAVCELLTGVPVEGSNSREELVTPTGAALVKGLAAGFGPFPTMRLERVGYGAGSRDLADGRPNLLRLVLGFPLAVAESQQVEVIETHLDDWSPEGYPYLSEMLFARGALDVAIMPIQMKKGRPGWQLRVIADPATAWELKRLLLTETTAIGLRYRPEQRWTLPRQQGTVATPWGPVQVKRVETPAGVRLAPEYEACRQVAVAHGISLAAVYAEIGRRSPADFLPLSEDQDKTKRSPRP